jgi:hypothetical protein
LFEGSHTLAGVIHTTVWELNPEPLIVTVATPVLGHDEGLTEERWGEAAAGGIPAATRRHKRIRQRKSGNRFMPVLLY